jgi:phosphoglycolate phosphatase-like HAD superfamily hydrolase
MFTIKQTDYSNKLVLPRTMAACPSDNDGVHLNSEPYIQACIIAAVAKICDRTALTPVQRELVRSTFGQADNIMSMDLYDKASNDPELGKSPIWSQHTRESFVPFFIQARADVWKEWTSDGRIEPKPGAVDYLNEFRNSDRLFGLVTGMPYDLVDHSVSNVLKAGDILPADRDRRVCCDDERLEGRGKPDPRGYELGMGHFVDAHHISPRDMWMVEDRANGAVAALRARYNGAVEQHQGEQIGKVIVIPDANDVNPVAEWDKKNLMEKHLAQFPEDRERLVFLRSLEDLTFSR